MILLSDCEAVLCVAQPIAPLGAEPGDELIIRSADPDFPVMLRRTFGLEMLATIPDAAIEQVDMRITSKRGAVSGPERGLRLVR